jgi:N-formylglutamate amidohydrolase
VSRFEAITAEFGWSHARNTPFGGTVVPHAAVGDERVSSLMLEVNRALYMDEQTTTRTPGFRTVERWVAVLTEAAVESLG